MDEQHAEVGIAALADRAEPASQPTGMLAGREAEVARNVAARGEALGVADEGDERGGGQEADAGDRLQRGDARRRRGEDRELLLDRVDAVLEVADLGADGRESRVEGWWEGGVAREERGHAREHATGADRDRDPELPQHTAHGW